MTDVDRIEDLEVGLRQIVFILLEDGHHKCCDRDDAAIAIALSLLGAEAVPRVA